MLLGLGDRVIYAIQVPCADNPFVTVTIGKHPAVWDQLPAVVSGLGCAAGAVVEYLLAHRVA
ncbi:MAG: hypothetical protein JWR37_4296 [Mycobacterium sp.]|nr:hypothetical protein [Mycobacterium sp.]